MTTSDPKENNVDIESSVKSSDFDVSKVTSENDKGNLLSIEEKSSLKEDATPELNKISVSANNNKHLENETNELSTEERKKRRQELIDRQRNASSNTDSFKIPTPEKDVPILDVSAFQEEASQAMNSPDTSNSLRGKLVDEAAQFLVNPKLAEFSSEKKLNFLVSKGLTSEEIQLAKLKAGSLTTSTMNITPSRVLAPPPLPPRQYAKKESTLPVSLLLKQFSYLALISSSISLVVFLAFKRYALPFLIKIFNARSWILKNRKRQYQNLKNECADLETYQKFDIVTDPGTNSIVVEQVSLSEKNAVVLSSILTTSDDLVKTLTQMNNQRNRSVGRTAGLMKEIASLFSFYLHQIPSPSTDPSVWSRSDSPSGGLKSEIRSLKGILLRTSTK